MSEVSGENDLPAVVDMLMPAEPAVLGPDPRLFEIVPFIGYDDEGRFTDEGKMGIAILEQKVAAGQQILINTIANRNTEWFDATTGQVMPRPVLAVPAELTTPVNTSAEAFELPACKMVFTGPVGVEYEHPGGPFTVGFTIPGTYTIKAEPFPAQPFTITLTVTA